MILEAARKQVRADGFYFEQSTYYHVYALDFFLHARILAALNGVAIPADFDDVVIKMLDALCLLGRAGLAPTLGDDDGGRVFDPRRNRAVAAALLASTKRGSEAVGVVGSAAMRA